LIAISLLPISPEKNTIIYGSNDRGKVVHAEDRVFNKKMKEAAKKLNLKPHYAGIWPHSSKLLYSACDIEGHKGTDGKYYLLDFSRVWPPEAPKPG
jgi:hypothetical protein